MKLIEIVEAILDNDIAKLRDAFAEFVIFYKHDVCYGNVVMKAICHEVCSILREDVHLLPQSLCERLGIPIGSSYSHGAESVKLCLPR